MTKRTLIKLFVILLPLVAGMVAIAAARNSFSNSDTTLRGTSTPHAMSSPIASPDITVNGKRVQTDTRGNASVQLNGGKAQVKVSNGSTSINASSGNNLNTTVHSESTGESGNSSLNVSNSTSTSGGSSHSVSSTQVFSTGPTHINVTSP